MTINALFYTVWTGDFLTDELPKADLYILVRILHDLTDEKLHVLLRKISDACTPGTKKKQFVVVLFFKLMDCYN